MRYTPKPKNRKCETAGITLLISAVVMFFFASQSYVKGKAAVQFIGVCTLAAGAYFVIKRLTVFTYIIMPQNPGKEYSRGLLPSELAFTVAKRKGSGGEAFLCQMDLGSLKSISPLPADSKKRKEIIDKNKPMSVYKYTATVGKCEASLLVFSKPGYEKTGLILEPDGEMYGYLKSVVEINKNFAQGDF